MNLSVPQGLRSGLSIVALSILLSACAARTETAGPLPGDPQFTQIAQSDAGQSDSGGWSESESDDFGPEPSDNDPLEVPNRMFFAFNEALDFAIIRPIAVTYNFIVPTGVRNTVTNFLRNLRSPVVFANDLLQGDLDRAGTTAARFFINSTLGILGIFDFASLEGYEYHDEDFGQTMGTYGAGEGFYLVLPILGPSSLRDGTGRIVDIFLDPLTYLVPRESNLGLAVTGGLDARSRNVETLDELKADSLDFYARIRSLYRQHRENEINNGAPSGDAPKFSEIPGQSTSALE